MIKDTIAANEAVTPNSREMAVLKDTFPSCFHADGSFDIERFKEFLSDKVSVGGRAGREAQCEAGERQQREHIYQRR